MTCKEQYIKDHPNLSEEAVEGVVRNMCPHDYGYLDEAYWCNGRNKDNCEKCWDRKIQECYTDGTEKIAGDKQKQVAQLKVIGDKEPECVGSYTTHTGNIDVCFDCAHATILVPEAKTAGNEKFCHKFDKKIVGNVIHCTDHVPEESEFKKFKDAGEAFKKSVAEGLEGASAATKSFVERFNEASAKFSKYSGAMPRPVGDKEPECVTPPELTEDAKKAIDAISKYVGDKFGLSVDTPQIKDNNEEVIKEPVDVTIGDIPLRDISSESLKVTVKPGNIVNVSASDSSSSTTRTGMIKDSGARREFGTGAVRDIQEGKGRCDLLPLDVIAEYYTKYVYSPNCRIEPANAVLNDICEFQNTGNHAYLTQVLLDTEIFKNDFETAILEVSKHFEEGAKKYGEYNWQKGIPTHCYIDSAVRHYFKHIRGDKDEPHDRAFVWNILCCIWTCIHKPELNDYSKEKENE